MTKKANNKLSRRHFIKGSSMGVLGAGMLGMGNMLRPEQVMKKERPKIKEYRTLGRTGFKTSDIGLGATLIQSEAVIAELLNSGVNYINTSEAYPTESIIGKCIKRFDRKSLFINTKVQPRRGFKTKEQIVNRVRKSLARLQTDYIDCLMIHGANSIKVIKNEAFHAAVNQLKSEGRLRFCGVSCHGTMYPPYPKETMENILLAAVDDGRFDVLLLSYNYLYQDMGKNIMKACKVKNIGTTIMKTDPYNRYFELIEYIDKNTKEGHTVQTWIKNLVPKFEVFKEQSESFIKKYKLTNRDEIKRAAIRFVLDNPNVNCALVSFVTFQDIEKYIKASGNPLSY